MVVVPPPAGRGVKCRAAVEPRRIADGVRTRWCERVRSATLSLRMERAMDIRLKRAYEPATASDGYRVLVDRLWPRGVSPEKARLDAWERAIAPSTELRRWFGHDPARFDEFRRRYVDELAAQSATLRELRRHARKEPLTLVYAARDTEHNEAVVLAQLLRRGRRTR
jgi:uncharacterized protein YeaO (DUF488 family)